jgi:hypothetical protein
MTLYAGEEVKVTSTVSDFDGVALTDLNVQNVKVTIYDSTPAIIVNAATMSYDSTRLYFYYMWNTTGRSPGTYKAKVVATGADGLPSWEWKRIRLARDLVTT